MTYPSGQRGFTYIGLLLAVAIIGLFLSIAGRVWSTTERREREQQLLWVGHAYRLAIASFYASGHRFPSSLEELLQDDRSPVPHHHLRRLYPDPLTGRNDWTLVLTPDGQGIMGVASSATAAPIKRRNFDLVDESFKDADCYCLWQFVYFPNRFTRFIGATAPSSPAPNSTIGTFNPGSISSLPQGSGNPLPAGSPFAPGNNSNSNTDGATTNATKPGESN